MMPMQFSLEINMKARSRSAAIIEPITRGNPLMSKYKTELEFILRTVRAMIEAQEQSHENG